MLLSHPLTPDTARPGLRPQNRAGYRRGPRRHLGKRVTPASPSAGPASQAPELRPGRGLEKGTRPDGGSPGARLPAASPRTARRSEAPQLQRRRLLAASHTGRRGAPSAVPPLPGCVSASPLRLPLSSSAVAALEFLRLLPPPPPSVSSPRAARLLHKPKHKHSGSGEETTSAGSAT